MTSADPLAERQARGRALRDQVPRSAHAEFTPAPSRPDPVDVLVAQNADRVPHLVPIRFGRMAPTPFTFFRGAAAIMAGDLAGRAVSGARVQLCGDAHLANFGLFATPERRLVFSVNDFDETLPGPWEWDVQRLAASLVVAAESQFPDLDPAQRREVGRTAAVAAAAAYRRRIAEYAQMTTLDVWYATVDVYTLSALAPKRHQRRIAEAAGKARRRTSMQALHRLAHREDDRYRIVADPPLVERLPDEEAVAALVRQILDHYRTTLAEERRVLFDRYRLRDVASKVVGVGSVGTRCFIVLFEGDGAPEGADPLFLQVKEASASVLEAALGPSELDHHGQRVVVGQRLMQAFSDIFLGWATNPANGRHFYLRQLRDMKGSFDVTTFEPEGLARYGGLCGWTLARAHARAGDPAVIAGYLGRKDTFDRAMGEFAVRYSRQNTEDHTALVQAIADGRVESAG